MSSHGASESLMKIPQSDSKVAVGAKRQGEELEEDSQLSRKHFKMKDLQSEGIDNHEVEMCKEEDSEEQMNIVETQSSQVLDKNAIENADARHIEVETRKSSSISADHNVSMPLDLNTEVYTDENSGYTDAVLSLGDPNKYSSNAKGKARLERNHMSSGGNRLDLNAEDVASSANPDPLYTYKSQNNPKKRETSSSESGKNTGHAEDKDALRKWKEMKKNGFMSSSNGYGGIPPAAPPKQRGRKSKSEVLKQKIEQGKKEQVDRFTKIAAPSGLLNGLNPGIINHVRNSKQVHSIIQALVRSEKRESRRQASEMVAGSGELGERNTEQENVNFSGAHASGLSYAVSSLSSMPESTLLCENRFSHKSSALFNPLDRSGCRDSGTEEKRACAKTSLLPHSKNYSEDDILELKLASSTKVSESTSCLSNEESSVDTLSVKAATVASQWLQLLHQDIKGRLAALRRSKKRVRAVITTELPFLLSKQFPCNQENDPYVVKDSVSVHSNKATAELHQSQWSRLFDQMDSNLSEEEKQLECWLNQVSEMMLHCGDGLQHVQWNTIYEMQHMGIADNNLRPKINDQEKDLSVRAAAASIYATCNHLSSQENVSCC